MVTDAGLRLGGFAFLAGMCAGPVRELALAPRIGGQAAAWLEFAVLAPFLAWAAWRWVAAGLSLPIRLVTSMLAVAVVVLLEAALGFAFNASGLATARAPRGPAEQLPGYILLAWLATLPVLRR